MRESSTVVSTATVSTPRPDRYIKQLVSHLGHKASTELNEDGSGTVTLSSGQCTLSSADGGLHMVATAGDDEQLAGVQDVITRHLVRFASQEELSVTWQRAN